MLDPPPAHATDDRLYPRQSGPLTERYSSAERALASVPNVELQRYSAPLGETLVEGRPFKLLNYQVPKFPVCPYEPRPRPAQISRASARYLRIANESHGKTWGLPHHRPAAQPTRPVLTHGCNITENLCPSGLLPTVATANSSVTAFHVNGLPSIGCVDQPGCCFRNAGTADESIAWRLIW
jgi:hypothetical protein